MKESFFQRYQQFFGLVVGSLIISAALFFVVGKNNLVQPVYAAPGDVVGSPNVIIGVQAYKDTSGTPQLALIAASGLVTTANLSHLSSGFSGFVAEGSAGHFVASIGRSNYWAFSYLNPINNHVIVQEQNNGAVDLGVDPYP